MKKSLIFSIRSICQVSYHIEITGETDIYLKEISKIVVTCKQSIL